MIASFERSSIGFPHHLSIYTKAYLLIVSLLRVEGSDMHEISHIMQELPVSFVADTPDLTNGRGMVAFRPRYVRSLTVGPCSGCG